MTDGEGVSLSSLRLDQAPTDPLESENYDRLYALWSRLAEAHERGERLTPAEFEQWDNEVQSLLRPYERERFLKPLRPFIPHDRDTTPHARQFHLTKILWARHGIEKLMKDTGY